MGGERSRGDGADGVVESSTGSNRFAARQCQSRNGIDELKANPIENPPHIPDPDHPLQSLQLRAVYETGFPFGNKQNLID